MIIDLVRLPDTADLERTSASTTVSPGRAHPDPRREPVGPVRPAGVAGVPRAREAGYEVSVICPRGHSRRTASRTRVIDGIEIHRYPLTAATGGRAATCASTAPRSGTPGAWRARSPRPLRRRPHLQPARPAVPGRAAAEAARGARRSSTSTTSCPSSSCRASARAGLLLPRPGGARAARPSGSPIVVIATNDSYRRVAHRARPQGARARVRRAQRPRPEPLRPGAARSRAQARQGAPRCATSA